MEEKHLIYKLTSPSGGVYIGQTCQSIEQRGGKNGKNYITKRQNGKFIQPLIANAILKYGWDNFRKEVLYENLTQTEANRLEIQTIKEYRQKGKCYNISNGGDGLDGVNERKIKQYHLNGEFIKEWDSLKSAEEYLGIYKAQANICACCQGKKKRAYGFIWRYSDSDLEVVPLIPYRSPIGQYDLNGNLLNTFKTIKEASQVLHISETGIGNVLHNRAKTSGGYVWKFL